MGESLLARKVREFGGLDQLVDAIGPERAYKLANTWRAIARPEQLMPGERDASIARSMWRTWLLLAGRGFGKTRTGAETVVDLVDAGRYRSIALIAPTYKAVRRLMIEHPVSGILARSSAWNYPAWKKDDGELHWPNGAIAYVYTAEEPDGPRGFNGDLAWCEEVGSWQYPNETWANLQLGLRIRGPKGDPARAIVTTTPRPIELIKQLVANDSTVVTGGTTYDNAANLDPEALKEFIALFEGTRLGKQELLAILLGDTPGALWTLAMLELNRVRLAPIEFKRIVVAVDPATKDVSSAAADQALDEKAAAESAETGIVVCGIAECRCKCVNSWDKPGLHGFVLEDASGMYTPGEWAAKVASVYRKWNADRVIAEINQGGALVESNIRTLGDSTISYKGVNASKGKQTRAEPIAAFDEKGMIHHVGVHPRLEDQMCTWQPLRSKKSPDRMDARVWGFTELMLEGITPPWTGGKARAVGRQ